VKKGQPAGIKVYRIFKPTLAAFINRIHDLWKPLLFSIVFSLWTFNCLLAQVNSGVDGSWKIGLNWALSNGWQWGRDIMFTYGPLFWLHSNIVPALMPMPLIIFGILAFNLAAAACAGYLFSRFVPKELGLSGLALLFLISYSLLIWDVRSTPLELFIVLALVLFVDYLQKQQTKTQSNNSSSNRLPLVIILFVLVVSQYVKFSHFAVSISLIIFMAFALYISKRVNDAVMMILAYPILSLIIWWGLGQSPANLPQYVQWGFLLSGGYTEAMQVNFTKPEFYQAWIFVLVLGLLYVLAGTRFLYRKRFFSRNHLYAQGAMFISFICHCPYY
jgi:hypothetical protein